MHRAPKSRTRVARARHWRYAWTIAVDSGGQWGSNSSHTYRICDFHLTDGVLSVTMGTVKVDGEDSCPPAGPLQQPEIVGTITRASVDRALTHCRKPGGEFIPLPITADSGRTTMQLRRSTNNWPAVTAVVAVEHLLRSMRKALEPK